MARAAPKDQVEAAPSRRASVSRPKATKSATTVKNASPAKKNATTPIKRTTRTPTKKPLVVSTSDSESESSEEEHIARPSAQRNRAKKPEPQAASDSDDQAPTVSTNVKQETVIGPGGTTILRQTTTTTVITVEEEQIDLPKIFPNLESTPIYRRASLFRSFVLADWITTLNCVCGVGSILFCLNYLANNQEDRYLDLAFAVLPFALFFDIIDGWVARKQKKHSPWGSDLDSLSDCISFTLAPAALGFTVGLRSFWDCLALCFFTFCGISRLARYNVTSQTIKQGEKVPYYEGFPVPTSLVLDSLLFFFYKRGLILQKLPLGIVSFLGKEFHILSIIFVVWGCLFVSASIRIPKP